MRRQGKETWTQATLFGPGNQGSVPEEPPRKNPPAPARRTDPETSKVAGAAMADGAATMRERVLNLFRAFGRLTHPELYLRYRQEYGFADDDSIRPRCGELKRLDCIRDSGERKASVKRPGGRAVRVVVWQYVPPDQRSPEVA